jgi:hypothetical protein
MIDGVTLFWDKNKINKINGYLLSTFATQTQHVRSTVLHILRQGK